jgi:hypothetical protein
MEKEPGMLRYLLIAGAMVFGGTALAMYFNEKNKPVQVIREAQMAPPAEMQQPPPEEPKREPAQENKQVIKNMDHLAGKVDGILKAGPKFKGR